MEKIYEPNLLYVQEHFSCPNYLDEVKYGFRYRKYAKGTLLERNSTYAYTIFFVHQGIVRLNYNGYQERDIYAGEMFLIGMGSPFYIEFIEDTTALAMIFENWDSHCAVSPFVIAKTILSRHGLQCKYLGDKSSVATFSTVASDVYSQWCTMRTLAQNKNG
jgi:hypothetical protein